MSGSRSLLERIDADFKQALRSKDATRVACIRQIKARLSEAATAKGFRGEVDDALALRVIEAYVKSLQKAVDELGGKGERGDELAAAYREEIAYLEPFLPERMSEDDTRALVRRTVDALGVRDPRRAGHVMGAIMKEHRDAVDAALVRRLVDEAMTED